jgi:hypothetical protein
MGGAGGKTGGHDLAAVPMLETALTRDVLRQAGAVVRGPAELDETWNPNLVIVPGLVPLVDKQSGEIEYVVAHLPDVVSS